VTTPARQQARRVLEIEAEAVRSLLEDLDAGFDAAVDAMKGTVGRVVVTGIGKSGIVGQKIAATLASTGTASFFLHPTEAIHGDLGVILKGDVVLAVSYSGETEELIALAPHVKRRGASP
jgi:arabinose-5-phosphate isomerase